MSIWGRVIPRLLLKFVWKVQIELQFVLPLPHPPTFLLRALSPKVNLSDSPAKQVWEPLTEKAVSKLRRCYEALVSGSAAGASPVSTLRGALSCVSGRIKLSHHRVYDNTFQNANISTININISSKKHQKSLKSVRESGQVYCKKYHTSNKLQHICNCIHQRNYLRSHRTQE